MNHKNFERIDSTLKVGMNCYFMSVSAILEYKNMLSVALTYSNFDFIYNPDFYTVFVKPKPVEEYISKDNPLLIPGGIDSFYHKQYNRYIENMQEKYNMVSFVELDPNVRLDFKQLKERYLDMDSPVIFCCDHYYMYNEYRKKTGDILHYHSPVHMATVVDIDFDGERCYVIDKFFSYVGEITFGSYLNATTSSYIRNFNCFETTINDKYDMREEDRLALLLKENIENSLEDYVYIDDIKYYKNMTALEMILNNFDDHIIDIYNQKGKYAPQFTTKILTPVRLNKKGFCNLLRYIKDTLKIGLVSEIEQTSKEIITAWTIFDQVCDKCFLTGNTTIDYKDRLKQILQDIYEKEKYMFNDLYKLKNIL